jgi:predicted nucleic acid-binding protein
VPERALLLAEEADLLALSAAVDTEIAEVLGRPILRGAAIWFDPTVTVSDCRDPKGNKYLELALAASADTIISSDADLLMLHPWRNVRILRPADYLARIDA